MMLFRQGRILARNIDEAILKITKMFDVEKISIYECNIQTRPGIVQFEYVVQLKEDENESGV